jgi:hypothetical protein
VNTRLSLTLLFFFIGVPLNIRNRSKMTPCPIANAFDHSILIAGSQCPFCTSSPAGSSSTASNLPQESLSSRSQYTPVTAGTVAALRQTVGQGNAARAKAVASARASNLALGSQLPTVYKFAVRVAHASYEGDPPMTKWTVWAEGWTVAITHNSATSFYTLKDTLRSQGQSQFIPYFNAMTQPQGYGHWTLAANHLEAKSPAPQLWCTWEGEYTIQDIIALQDFKLAKGVTTYPVTLLWYPKMQDPDSFTVCSDACAFGDASLLPARGSSPTFTELSPLPEPLELTTAVGPPAAPASPPPTKKQVKNNAKGTHKRQISEAVPRTEREVARVPQEVAKPVDVRKSTRLRKPKSRS